MRSPEEDYIMNSTSEATRHHRLYFVDGNIIFRAGNILFNVHRYFFVRDSPLFQTMFFLPPGEGEEVEGRSDEKPIHLSGVSPIQFEHFLDILYPLAFGVYSGGLSKWTDVLDLATRWEFDSIRALAIWELNAIPDEKIPLVNRIDIGRRLGIREWLLPSYVDFITRPGPVTIEEARILGMEDVVIIFQSREAIKREEYTNDRTGEIYYGIKHKPPLNTRQNVWDEVAIIFNLPKAPVRSTRHVQ